jgi:hypothetical protein
MTRKPRTLERSPAGTVADDGGVQRSHRRCGAKTRAGTPCLMKPVGGKRRCRLHGGLSTGPKTAEGRERIAAAQRARHFAGKRQPRVNG